MSVNGSILLLSPHPSAVWIISCSNVGRTGAEQDQCLRSVTLGGGLHTSLDARFVQDFIQFLVEKTGFPFLVFFCGNFHVANQGNLRILRSVLHLVTPREKVRTAPMKIL